MKNMEECLYCGKKHSPDRKVCMELYVDKIEVRGEKIEIRKVGIHAEGHAEGIEESHYFDSIATTNYPELEEALLLSPHAADMRRVLKNMFDASRKEAEAAGSSGDDLNDAVANFKRCIREALEVIEKIEKEVGSDAEVR